MTFIKSISVMQWCVLLLVILCYGQVSSFNAILNKFLNERYGYSITTSGYLAAIPTLTCSIICPFIGYIVDKKGYRCIWLIVSFTFASLG